MLMTSTNVQWPKVFSILAISPLHRTGGHAVEWVAVTHCGLPAAPIRPTYCSGKGNFDHEAVFHFGGVHFGPFGPRSLAQNPPGNPTAEKDQPLRPEQCPEPLPQALLEWPPRVPPPAMPRWERLSKKPATPSASALPENLKQAHVDVDMQTLMKGLTDSLTSGKLAMTDKEMGEAVQQFQKEQDTKASDKNKKDGTKFLADNKSKEGVKTTASGLQYKVLKSGTGATPGPNDEVTAHYKGTLLDGKVFDSSYDRGEPIHIQANRVIKGWTEALQLMKVGDKWQLFVPAELAYGDQGTPPVIGPNSVLVFEVELLDVKKAGGAENSMQLQPLPQK